MKKMEYPVIIFFYEKKILKKMINLTNNIQLFLYSLIYMRNRIMRMYKKKISFVRTQG